MVFFHSLFKHAIVFIWVQYFVYCLADSPSERKGYFLHEIRTTTDPKILDATVVQGHGFFPSSLFVKATIDVSTGRTTPGAAPASVLPRPNPELDPTGGYSLVSTIVNGTLLDATLNDDLNRGEPVAKISFAFPARDAWHFVSQKLDRAFIFYRENSSKGQNEVLIVNLSNTSQIHRSSVSGLSKSVDSWWGPIDAIYESVQIALLPYYCPTDGEGIEGYYLSYDESGARIIDIAHRFDSTSVLDAIVYGPNGIAEDRAYVIEQNIINVEDESSIFGCFEQADAYMIDEIYISSGEIVRRIVLAYNEIVSIGAGNYTSVTPTTINPDKNVSINVPTIVPSIKPDTATSEPTAGRPSMTVNPTDNAPYVMFFILLCWLL